mgnify:CR=1 FL=1
MKIFDCSMYFDEDMLLDVRLNILDKYVDKFIIVESKYLHSGKEKTLNFNIKNFTKYKNKIEYLVLNENPKNIELIQNSDNNRAKEVKRLNNALRRENFQRNFIMKGLHEAEDEDLVLISDIDEIPELSQLKNIKKINMFVQKMIYYKFNLMQPNMNWCGTRACKKKYLISPQWLRNIKDKSYPFWRFDTIFSKKKFQNINFIQNGGWHFTSIKSPKDIFYKLSNFLHHHEFEESGLTENDMKKMISEEVILYDHSVDKTLNKYTGNQKLVKINDNELPRYLIENKQKFFEWFV